MRVCARAYAYVYVYIAHTLILFRECPGSGHAQHHAPSPTVPNPICAQGETVRVRVVAVNLMEGLAVATAIEEQVE